MEPSADSAAGIRGILRQIDFLKLLKPHEVNDLIDSMTRRPFKRNETIIEQDSPAEEFFIVGDGVVGVYRNEKQVARLERDAFFGEMALLGDERRSASVVGEEEGFLYLLPRSSFKRILLANAGIAEVIRQTAEYRRAQNRANDINEKAGW